MEEQQDVLNVLKNKYRQISEEDLPSKLEEVGMSEFKLSDGTSISVNRFYSGRITEDNRDQCFHWLEENGHSNVNGLSKDKIEWDKIRGDEIGLRSIDLIISAIAILAFSAFL